MSFWCFIVCMPEQEYINNGFRPSLSRHIRRDHPTHREMLDQLGMTDLATPAPSLHQRKVAYWSSSPNKHGEIGILAVSVHWRGAISERSLWHFGWTTQDELLQAPSEPIVCVEAAEYHTPGPHFGLQALFSAVVPVQEQL